MFDQFDRNDDFTNLTTMISVWRKLIDNGEFSTNLTAHLQYWLQDYLEKIGY